MNLRHRLVRQERTRVPTAALNHVCLDEQGCILDDGSAPVRPWIGRHYQELRDALPRGAPLKVYLFNPQPDADRFVEEFRRAEGLCERAGAAVRVNSRAETVRFGLDHALDRANSEYLFRGLPRKPMANEMMMV